MENKNSKDMFDLSNNLLKKIINNITVPLCHIINTSLKSGEIPYQLKMAKVIPIFKQNGDKDLPTNYRPISLLPIFSKLVEKVVYIQLTDYLSFNNILSNQQYGFQAKKSTIHPMIHLVNEIGKAKNENKFTIGVFCDLRKCFDTISRPKLIKKLSKIGIRGTALKWFENYLSNRKQFVHCNKESSSKLVIDKGVPQGSILGPILFLIYINDLPTATDLFTLLFADDTSFLISGKNLNDIVLKLNKELKKICTWFRANDMSLNPEKTKFIIFNKQEKSINWEELNIYLDFNNNNENKTDLKKQLDFINTKSKIPAIKFLGVYIDPLLNFKYHINFIQKKIKTSVYMLNCAKKFLPLHSLKNLYYSFVHSHLSYCNAVWSIGLESSINNLVKSQKRCIRLITNSQYRAHTVPLFKKLDILPLYEICLISKLNIMHDFINEKLPISFQGMWKRNFEIRHESDRILRNHNDFYIPMAKFKCIERFPLYDYPKLWNEHCKNKNFEPLTKPQFKKKIKKMFMDKIEIDCHRPRCPECN